MIMSENKSSMMEYCPKCGFIGMVFNQNGCSKCNVAVISTDMTTDDYWDLSDTDKKEWKKRYTEDVISKNPLYDKERAIRLGRIREDDNKKRHAEWDKTHDAQGNLCVPKCPICNSTKLSKITTAKKATKIAFFGVFGMGG